LEVDAATAVTLAKAGRTSEARSRWKALSSGVTDMRDAPQLAGVLVALGQHAQALDWLEGACAARVAWLPSIMRDPALDDLRSEPRFVALLHRMGVPAGGDLAAEGKR
jgi:hypothetical protein